MSIEPEASEPRWAVPPVGGWTADDLDTHSRICLRTRS